MTFPLRENKMCLRIRGAGLLVVSLCRHAPALSPSNSRKYVGNFHAISFQVYLLHSWHPAANEGLLHRSVSALISQGARTANYCSPRSKKSFSLTRCHTLSRPECEWTTETRGANFERKFLTLFVSLLEVLSKHDFVTLRGFAPRTPKSREKQGPG